MHERIKFLLNRLGEKLWVKPLIMCVVSVSGAFIARMADSTNIGPIVPDITQESIETLLGIISSSMLVIATFAVASMVSAYASASDSATPRSFPLVIADDVSQNALSAFIGAFIFSIVAQIAVENGYYERAGRFTLLILTLAVFATVIMTFVWWVDRIARLGRLGTTIEKVEQAAAASTKSRLRAPTLGGTAVTERSEAWEPVQGDAIGYVQRVDMATLQAIANEIDIRIELAALPGTFVDPSRPLAYLSEEATSQNGFDPKRITEAFLIGKDRTFDDDPRFGLIVLSEIASRALSPGINDPGTAIGVIGSLLRIVSLWSSPPDADDPPTVKFDRVAVPELSLQDLFDDAFTAISRDGAGTLEVVIRLQKAFQALASTDNTAVADVAREYARLLTARAENQMTVAEDLNRVRAAGQFAEVH